MIPGQVLTDNRGREYVTLTGNTVRLRYGTLVVPTSWVQDRYGPLVPTETTGGTP